VKPRRRHAEHGEGISVDLERSAQDRRIATEPALPEVMAQDHERRRARPIPVVRREQAAEVSACAEDAEEVRRHHGAEAALGAVSIAKAHRLRAGLAGIDVGEDGIARSEVEIVRVRPVVEALTVL
jgi:hypothetical protein